MLTARSRALARADRLKNKKNPLDVRSNYTWKCLVAVFAWLDTGTHSSLVEASHFVQILEQRQGLRIACPEEIALRKGYITLSQFDEVARKTSKSSYGEYLLAVSRSFKN